jgi:predicted nucleotidyltransferase
MMGEDQQILTSIIKKHLPSVKIYLFGSRARGDYKSTSDVDIALDAGEKIDLYTLSLIKEEIEESIIPFTVDVVDLYNVSEDFKKNILKDGKLWT